MANDIFSAKLAELDSKICRIHEQISSSEASDHSLIIKEADALKLECAAEKQKILTVMQGSKAQSVRMLTEPYSRIEEIIRTTAAHIFSAENSRESQAEEITLLAEYSLDFAMLAVSHALFVSLKAIDAQMTLQESKEEEEE